MGLTKIQVSETENDPNPSPLKPKSPARLGAKLW
jgi:hypothetical protein